MIRLSNTKWFNGLKEKQIITDHPGEIQQSYYRQGKNNSLLL